MGQVIEVDTDRLRPPNVGNDLYANRSAMADLQQSMAAAEVTIVVVAYKRLEKTKRCVSSILAHTGSMDYELVLVDHGSNDGTLEYFCSIPFEKKKVIHITQNLGTGFPGMLLEVSAMGKFVCLLPGDIILTKNWLSNLLACAKSDIKIGMVTPMTSNCSNLQSAELPYRTYQEMQAQAERFNHSDPKKWEDRQRLITLGTLYRKEALLASGWPVSDVGFFHDFADDDVSFRLRRMGYRTVLAGDTWICHDHNVSQGEDKNIEEMQASLKIGQKNFSDKYFGIDAWSDVCNYYIPFMDHFPPPDQGSAKRAVLGVDVKCGTPILDIKNWLRKCGIFDVSLSAFTQDPKYWMDLKTICAGPVICDREEFLKDSFLRESFDYVIADRPINRYHEPQKILRDMFDLCKPLGIVICKLANTYSFREYLNMLGQRDIYNPEIAYNISIERLQAALSAFGEVQKIVLTDNQLQAQDQEILASLIPGGLSEQDQRELLQRMQCGEVLFIVKKSGGSIHHA